MRIVIDTKKVTKPVAKFFGRTVEAIRAKRVQRAARVLCNVETKVAQRALNEQARDIKAKRAAKSDKVRGELKHAMKHGDLRHVAKRSAQRAAAKAAK